MKNIAILLMCVVICLSLFGCSLFYDYALNAVDGFDVGYSNIANKAFLSTYHWDGTDKGTQLVVPEEYEGIPITTLGGYFGRGVPCYFNIELTDIAKEKLCNKSNVWYDMSDIQSFEIGEIQTVEFDIHISKNINEIVGLAIGDVIGCKYVEDEIEYYDIFVLTCTITCDDRNETFYAEDGKLYYSDGDILVSEILYFDFDIDEYISQKQ